VTRQFIFYGTDGSVVEKLSDNNRGHKVVRTGGEWWIIIKVGEEFRIARTLKFEYLNTSMV
jgi:hypothetical protein